MFSTIWNTQRFRELGREEKGGRGRQETGNLVERKQSPKRERAVKPVISLPRKRVLKIGFLKLQN